MMKFQVVNYRKNVHVFTVVPLFQNQEEFVVLPDELLCAECGIVRHIRCYLPVQSASRNVHSVNFYLDVQTSH